MGCSVSSPDPRDLWAVVPDATQPTIQQENECAEGYLARAGNQTGEQGGGPLQGSAEDTATVNPKIATVSITPHGDLTINQQLKPSKQVGTLTWQVLNVDNSPASIPNVTFGPDGHITGTFQNEGTYTVRVILKKDGTEVDNKIFKVVAAKFKNGLDIKFQHPLPGSVVTSKCGNRVHPVTGQIRPHKGTDFAYANHKTGPVLASADGEVVFAGVQNGYGNLVILGHTNAAGKRMCVTKYAHLDKIYVNMGQKVAAGDQVGFEGNTGVGTGAHLHFEIRSGTGQGDQVFDPEQYISGKVKSVASSPTAGTNGDADPGNIPTGAQVVETDNGSVPLTVEKVNDACQGYQTDVGLAPNGTTSNDPTGGATTGGAQANQPAKASSQSACKPNGYTPPTKSQVVDQINTALNADSDLDAEDKKIILFIAQVESNFDPYAKNKTSSATGLYQMVNGTAAPYFAQIGASPTCENRCDIQKSTQAYIAYYKHELRRYWNDYVASGKTKIAGKPIVPTAHSNRYPGLSKLVFTYGCLHHDGVGSAQQGKDLGGVDYCIKRLNQDSVAMRTGGA